MMHPLSNILDPFVRNANWSQAMLDVHCMWLSHLIYGQCSASCHLSFAPACFHATWANIARLCLVTLTFQWHLGIFQLPW